MRETGPLRLRRGFTLIELLVVIVIIGILMGFILTAAMGGVRAAEERASQSLIIKLDTALADRIEAIMEQRPDINLAHNSLAAVFFGGSQTTTFPPSTVVVPLTMPQADLTSGFIPTSQRAQVIAQMDLLKAELPDVFVYDSTNASYPINFAAVAFPGNSHGITAHDPFVLPLGNNIDYNPGAGSFGAFPVITGAAGYNFYGTGIYGASYTAAAALYKSFGAEPAACDGTDNNNNNMIDDLNEWSPAAKANLITNLSIRHQHRTARSEMLYALLVNGQGPLGSLFKPDDFTPREVGDTDGDGAPEFIDAWGQPIQFYRWPVLHHSDVQRGMPDSVMLAQLAAQPAPANNAGPYFSILEPRDVNPVDPSQQLLSPSWWSGGGGVGISTNNMSPFAGSNLPLSGSAVAFQTFFHSLLEPLSASTASAPQNYWDRGGTYGQRRAFYSRHLIVSSGQDKLLGVAMLGVSYPNLESIGDGSGAAVPLTVTNLIQIENQGAAVDPNRGAAPYYKPALNQTTSYLETWGQDDISSHNLQSSAGATK